MFKFDIMGRAKSDDLMITFEAPFSLAIKQGVFVNHKLRSLYTRILTDCYSKSKGWEALSGNKEARNDNPLIMTPEEKAVSSLWDNFLGVGETKGLISIIAEAMVARTKQAIVYEKDVGLARKATIDEKNAIEADYKAKNRSETGIIVDFSKYDKTLILRLYLYLLYDVLASSNTNLKISQAIVFKIAKLREQISKATGADIQAQAKKLTDGLKRGDSIAVDGQDLLELNDPNTASMEKASTFLYSEIASELGVSVAYINAVLTTGMSVTGEADISYNEQGIKNFFDSIFEPICKALYGVNLSFQSNKWAKLLEYGANLIAIENSELISDEDKQEFVNYILGK